MQGWAVKPINRTIEKNIDFLECAYPDDVEDAIRPEFLVNEQNGRAAYKLFKKLYRAISHNGRP